MKTTDSKRWTLRLAHLLGGLTLAAAMASCGGGSGGGGSEPPPPSAELPASVTLAGPAQAETGASMSWQSSVAAVQPGWSVEWDFGDGTVSTQAQPSHAYARAGDYTVRYTLRRGTTDSRSATASVQVRAYAMSVDRNCSRPGASGWCWQQPRPYALDLEDAVLIDSKSAFAVGPGNAIVTTRNGGVDWTLQQAPASSSQGTGSESQRLKLVRFVDASVGVGSASFPGRVLRTVDGGGTWTATTPFGMWWVRAVWLLDRQTIVVSGFRNDQRFGYGLRFGDLSLISSDGGQTWREAALVVSSVTNDRVLWGTPWANSGFIRELMISRDLGLTAEQVSPCCVESLISQARPDLQEDTDQLALSLVTQAPAQEPYRQRVHRSTDAGRTWATVEVQPPTGDLNQRLLGIGYHSATDAWATFSRPVAGSLDETRTQWQRARSRDGGRTWSEVGAPVADAGASRRQLLRLDTRGWAVVIDSPDALWFDDGDETVRTLRLPESGADLRRIQRRDGVLLAGFGAPDRWYLSADFGATWKPSPGAQFATPGSISGLWFFDSQRGVAADNQRDFLVTNDGGRNWVPQPYSPRRAWADLQFTADGTGWGLADAGLWRSVDRGLNWTAANLPAGNPSNLQAVDARKAWLLARTCTDIAVPESCQLLLHATRDGGATWVRLPAPDQVTRVHFTADGNGIAIANGQIWFSDNEGQSWTATTERTQPFTLIRIRFVDARNGWMLFSGTAGPRGGVSSYVMRTRDGGRTWSTLPAPSFDYLNDMAFGDANHGWVVGNAGLVWATRDAGDSWEAQPSGTARSLSVVVALDAYTAWAGGERSTLLGTGTGGR